MSITFILLTLLFLAVSVAMVLLILVQRPQGGGLAGAFGGAGGGGTDTAFGGRTGDALTLATVAAFGLFLALAIVINIIGNPRTGAAAAAVTPDAGLVDPEVADRSGDLPVTIIPIEGGGAPALREAAVDVPGQPATDAPRTVDPALTTGSTLPTDRTRSGATGAAGADATGADGADGVGDGADGGAGSDATDGAGGAGAGDQPADSGR